MLCSYWSFVFAFAHAGLQLRGFGRLVGAKSAVPAAVVWLARILVVAVSCYGVCAFVQLNMGAYLLGQAQFAFADFSVPIVLLFARYTAVAVLVTSVFHCLGNIASRNTNRRGIREGKERERR